ncbi:histidine kinase dimerization/phosphoacceptor domain -containing protein [Chitinophaga sp. CF418]|uniref:tetratricopeptide repeat-containing sensor histidine kinase n=1 Tax=Chitinophaga sp. CF418 TaxID=1855287 RepID=UPI000918B765|nr:histidine kinase dimerization/phosphoacceptor domain -containing protein [Chitinophaga sp. CF418]SHL96844.1 Two-component sensor histidine kinase, contains HisKA and HATPase domains [Chitinophaga sp. CF418]
MHKRFLIYAGLVSLYMPTNAQTGVFMKDTASINRMLVTSDNWAEKINNNEAFRDTALSLTVEAETLSRAIRFNDGILNSLLSRYNIYVKSKILKTGQKKDSSKETAEINQLESGIVGFVSSNKVSRTLGDVYEELGNVYNRDHNHFSEIRRLFEAAALFFKKSGDMKRESESLYEVGFIYNMQGNLEKARNTYLKSIEVGQAARGRKNLQQVYGTLGNTYTFQGDYKTALEYNLKALSMAEAEKDSSTTYGVINLYLGLVYEALKDKPAALKYYQAAFNVFQKYPKTNLGDLTSCIYNTGKMILYSNPETAITFVENQIKRFPALVSHKEYPMIQVLIMTAYLKLKDYQKAQKYCDEVIVLIDKSPPPEQKKLLPTVIQFFIASKQYDQAKKYLPLYQQISENENDFSNGLTAHKYWYKLDSIQGNFQSSLMHFAKYKAYGDSLFDQSKSREIARLQIQYETARKDNDIKLKERDIEALRKQSLLQLAINDRKEQDLQLKKKDIELLQGQQQLQLAVAARQDQDLKLKDQNIKLKEKDISLLTQESLLQAIRLKETRITRNYMIAGALMLVLLLGLAYNRFKVKQRSNREINAKNQSLQRLVEEKEWLLKEVHHRVKNNLQTVVSLLESQSAYLQDDALTAIQDSQNRVHAMSLIHQKLYLGENVASINMAVYLPELVNYLRDSFNVHQQIRFQLDIAPTELDVSQAVPLGLIVNEAITNSIKYAFVESRQGQVITVRLSESDEKHIELVISDNGKGLPDDNHRNRSGGLGLKLMKGLTEDIDGHFTIRADHGTRINISFMANLPWHKNGQIGKAGAIPQLQPT